MPLVNFTTKCLKLAEMEFIHIPLTSSFNPIALRKAKIVYNFGLSECNRIKHAFDEFR